MAANGEAIGEVEELLRLGGMSSDFAASSTTLVALLGRIRQQTPQKGGRITATPEEKRLFSLGAKALNYVAEFAETTFAQPTPVLSTEKWTTPRLRKPDLSRGNAHARISFMNMAMDLLMALAQGDETESELDSPQAIYGRTARSGDSTLDSEENLLEVASELLQLCDASAANSYSYENGIKVDLPAFASGGDDWNTVAFAYVVRTLAALACSHSVWFGTPTSHFEVELWGQKVPGTEASAVRKPHAGPPHEEGCVLYKVQGGIKFAMSPAQADRWTNLRVGFSRLASSSNGMLQAQAEQALNIVDGAVSGRHNSGANVSWDYSLELFNTAVLALRTMDSKASGYFNTPGTGVEAHEPGNGNGPTPNWQESLNLRRWAILECLDFLFSRKGKDIVRLNAASSIIILCFGGNIDSRVHRDHPETVGIFSVSKTQWTQEWREEMMGYVRQAIVGAAQFLSSQFDDADVKLGAEVVPKAKDREQWLRDRVVPRTD